MNERLDEFDRLTTINDILIENNLFVNREYILKVILNKFQNHDVSDSQINLEIDRIYKWRVQNIIECYLVDNFEHFSKEEILNDLILMYENNNYAIDVITSSVDEVIDLLINDGKILIDEDKYIVNHIEKIRRF